jgi:hypothetical protein
LDLDDNYAVGHDGMRTAVNYRLFRSGTAGVDPETSCSGLHQHITLFYSSEGDIYWVSTEILNQLKPVQKIPE